MSIPGVRYDTSSGTAQVFRGIRKWSAYSRVWMGARFGTRTLSGPIIAQVEAISTCNYACLFCRFHSEGSHEGVAPGGNGRSYMPLSVADRLARDLEGLGTLSVELIGRGEPLLHPQKLEFIETFRRRNLEVYICTNGVLLNAEVARELVALGVRTIRFGINAGSPDTHRRVTGAQRSGDFERVLAGARSVADYRRRAGRKVPYMMYGFVLMEENYREAKQAVREAAKAGIDAMFFKVMLNHDASSRFSPRDHGGVEAILKEAGEEAARLGVKTNLGLRSQLPLEKTDHRSASAEVYARSPCYVPWMFSLISSNGDVHGCCQCERTLGNLENGGFRSVWMGRAYKDFTLGCRRLPQGGLQSIRGCECDNCNFVVRNYLFHKFIHPMKLLGLGTRPVFSLRKMMEYKGI